MDQTSHKKGDYKYFVQLTVGKVQCRAMVDSGNLWRNVMSVGFLKQIGLSLSDLQPVLGAKQVGTAKAGSGLQILGELKTPISLMLGQGKTEFKCRPVVLEGLSMPFNISGPFLHENHIDQLHSEGALSVQGRKIRLVASLDNSTEEALCSNAYVIGKEVIPPHCTKNIMCMVAEVKQMYASRGRFG